MVRVPFIGRLALQEYLALIGSFILVGLELLIRVITLALPMPIVNFFYQISKRAFNILSSPQGRRSRNKRKSVSSPIAKASDFVELCELYGYYAEEHLVQTEDGYLLGLHRLGWRKGEEDQRVNGGIDSIRKKVVYLHHGLMMTSEVWVCLTEQERCLPFLLVEQGYDVWLGNNRGNKYSKKSVNCSPAGTQFWNFSMDQFAFHDIPNTIDYILELTQQPSLSYIGFSQGTAQAFATLSIHPQLNDKVNVFIALAPAMTPPQLANGVVSSMMKASPEVLFLLFGRKSLLSSTTMWNALLYPALFCWVIDKALNFLFGWHSENITTHQKLAAYPHLYSFTSTKSVVHWFQIIRMGTFQMYDDELQAPLSFANGAKYYKVAKFPTRNIKTPIFLLYGGSDSLVDIKVMMRELPKHTVATEIPHYEHLDFLWAADVHQQVFPHVLDALDFHNLDVKSRNGPFTPSKGGRLPALLGSDPTQSNQLSLEDGVDATNGDYDSDVFDEKQALPTELPSHAMVQAVAAPNRHVSPSQSSDTPNSFDSRLEGTYDSDDVHGGLDSPLTEQSVLSGERAHIKFPRLRRSRLSIESARSRGSSCDHGAGLTIGKSAAAEGLVSRETADVSPITRGWADAKASKQAKRKST